MQDIAPRIVCSVPGMWQSHEEIAWSIAALDYGLTLDGDSLLDSAGETFAVDVAGYEMGLAKDFSIAGRRSLSDDDVEAIKRHIQSIYLSGPGGSTERARAMMRAVTALLDAGGLAVKVETGGVAHSAAHWRTLAAAPEPVALYHAYVSMMASDKIYYSVGMHNLGLPDASLPRSIPAHDAAKTLEGFLLYLLYESPELSDTHTFSVDASSPRFKLQDAPCTQFPKEHLFFNPYGLWILH